MKITNLTEQTTMALSDSIPIGSTANGTRRVTLTTLAAAVLDTQTDSGGMEMNRSTPLTGASLSILPVTAGNSVWLLITPAGTLATLTVVLPGDGSTGGSLVADQQEVLVTSTQTLTSLTVSSVGKTVVGGPTTLSANGSFRLRYDAVTNAWYKVGSA